MTAGPRVSFGRWAFRLVLVVLLVSLIGWDFAGHFHDLTGWGFNTGYGVPGTSSYSLFWSTYWGFAYMVSVVLLVDALYPFPLALTRPARRLRERLRRDAP